MATQNRPYVFELAVQFTELVSRGEDGSDTRELAARNDVDAGELDRAIAIVQGFISSGADITQWLHQEYMIDGWLRGYLPLETSPADISTWTLGQLAASHYEVGSGGDAKSAPEDEPAAQIKAIEDRVEAIAGRIQDALDDIDGQGREILLAADRALADTANELRALSPNGLGEYGTAVDRQIDAQFAIIATHVHPIAADSDQQ
ncbi:hypothetical protein [Mycobacteroides abscessus]|uniref:hypothetical protein n=1 Tax=Mycobacteroides abscessus TaxID=36809 RepID=UPI00266B4A19|nr:hypothetical protein [Mycobacteroides abscessus]MDO3331515.1 hypothetical protein [Mycobacteroides abscessus subsp. abscessus]